MDKYRNAEDIELEALAQEFRGTGLIKPHYSDDYKRMVLHKVLVDHEPVIPFSKAIGVPKKTVYMWIRNFAAGKSSKKKEILVTETTKNPSPMPRKKQYSVESPEEELVRLREENKQLQEALKMAEWRDHAKDVMIDLAEKTFNIPIRKKSGAKQ